MKPNRTIKLRDERQIRGWILAVLVLLVVGAGLTIWWWRGGSFDVVGSVTRAITPQPASTAVPAATREAEPVAPAPAPSRTDDGDTAADPPVDAAPAPETDTAPAVIPIPLNEDAGRVFTVPLEITFDVESWTEITDGRGERLVYGLQAAGRRLTVRGAPPFAVVLGNASSARLTVDGEPYDIPPTRRGDDLARFSVDIAEE